MARLRQSASLALLCSLFLTSRTSSALEFAPGSKCAAYCLNDNRGDAFDPKDSTTNTTDIVCDDGDFSSKSKGIKFKNCQECLSKSNHVNGTQSDTFWYMYNMRYAISSCLFGNPHQVANPVNSPCIIDYACLPLEDSLAFDFNSTTEDANSWAYCDEKKDQFTKWKLKSCVSCLKASSDQTYLANFVVALGVGCDQRPKDGSFVTLTDTVFTTKDINGTAPEEDIRSRPAGAGSSTLTTGAIVGIAVGAGLLLFSGLGLFCIYYRKQKMYEATEKKGGDFFSSGGSGGVDGGRGGDTYTPDPFLPPEGAQMTSSLRHMSDDGGSFGGGGGGGAHMKGVSVSSAEYYDKLESEAIHTNYNFDPRSTNRGPNGALPSHPAYIPRAASRPVSEARSTPPPPPPAQLSSSDLLPPPPATRNGANPDGESFAMHRYTPSISSQRGSSSTRSTPKSSPHPPPPPPPPAPKNKVPSLVLPSLGRVRGPKKYSPPLVSRSGTPASMDRDRDDLPDRPPTAMQISQPVMTNEGRFQDTPLQGAQILATDGPSAAERNPRSKGWNEVPMKSGKSALYGY